jgi:cystathionine beta-lyase
MSEEFAQNSATRVSASKSFNLAGLRLASAVIPNPELKKKFTAALQVAGYTPQCSILAYEACRLAFQEGEAWLEGALRVIAGNAALVKERVEREIPGITVYDLEGTYLLWLDFKGLGLDYRELERRNQEALLFFDEGCIFGEGGRGFERWNLACPRRFVAGGLDRLAAAYGPEAYRP